MLCITAWIFGYAAVGLIPVSLSIALNCGVGGALGKHINTDKDATRLGIGLKVKK